MVLVVIFSVDDMYSWVGLSCCNDGCNRSSDFGDRVTITENAATPVGTTFSLVVVVVVVVIIAVMMNTNTKIDRVLHVPMSDVVVFVWFPRNLR